MYGKITEEILDIFLENFAQVESTALRARYKHRNMVDYFSRLIKECSQGEDCDPQKTCRVVIVAILRYHEKYMESKKGVCRRGQNHDVLYVAIKLCYDWQLKDNPIVVAVLDQIYLCEKTFERIWIGPLFGTRTPYYASGWNIHFVDQEDNFKAIFYLLDHATNARLEYPNENGEMIRYIDVPFHTCNFTPLTILIQFQRADKLHVLLRFGAEYDDNIVVQKLFNVLVFYERKYPVDIVACLRLLLRRSSMIRLQKENAESFNNVIKDCLLPVQRFGVEPPELKHLCRCCIRKRLGQNYQLPNGIRMLDIPKTLHTYLDLLLD